MNLKKFEILTQSTAYFWVLVFQQQSLHVELVLHVHFYFYTSHKRDMDEVINDYDRNICTLSAIYTLIY